MTTETNALKVNGSMEVAADAIFRSKIAIGSDVRTEYDLYVASGEATTDEVAAAICIERAPQSTSAYALKINSGRTLLADTRSDALIVAGGINVAGDVATYGTVQDKYNVKLYGAIGDGVADDTAAIQLAANSVDYIYFPYGKYKISSTINFNRGNITIRGDGATIWKNDTIDESVFRFDGGDHFYSSALVGTLAVGDNKITAVAAGPISENDWILITTSQKWYFSSEWMPRSNLVEVESVSGNEIKLHTPILVPITASMGATCFRPIRNIKIEGLTFLSSTVIPTAIVGTGSTGIRLNNTADVKISNCVFKHFYNKAIDTQYSFRVDVVGCQFFGVPDGFVMTYALSGGIAYYGHFASTSYGINTIDCYAYRIRHLSDGARVVNHRTSQCSSVAHHRSMIRLHTQCINSSVTNNWGFSTIGSGILNSSTPISIIANNHFIMLSSGVEATLVGDNTPTAYSPSDAATSISYPCVISNNIFESNPAETSTVVLGNYYSSLTITGNTCKNCTVGIEIRSLSAENIIIENNFINSSGGGSNDGILFSDHQYLKKRDNILIANNIIRNYGRSAIRFYAPSIISGRTKTLNIKNNIFDAVNSMSPYSGVFVDSGFFGANINIEDNWTLNRPSGAQTVIISKPANFERAPYISYKFTDQPKGRNAINVVAYETSSTLPSGTTIEVASIIMNLNITSGGSIGWICTSGGTYGSVSGVTATTDGTTTVALSGNSMGKISIGHWVVIAGRQVRIVDMSDDYSTAVVNSAINAATGAAVSYRNPTLVEYGRISNKIGTYTDFAAAVDARATSTSVAAVDIQTVASKLTNLITDLRTAGIIN